MNTELQSAMIELIKEISLNANTTIPAALMQLVEFYNLVFLFGFILSVGMFLLSVILTLHYTRVNRAWLASENERDVKSYTYKIHTSPKYGYDTFWTIVGISSIVAVIPCAYFYVKTLYPMAWILDYILNQI